VTAISSQDHVLAHAAAGDRLEVVGAFEQEQLVAIFFPQPDEELLAVQAKGHLSLHEAARVAENIAQLDLGEGPR
jgi:hypothetical protein